MNRPGAAVVHLVEQVSFLPTAAEAPGLQSCGFNCCPLADSDPEDFKQTSVFTSARVDAA